MIPDFPDEIMARCESCGICFLVLAHPSERQGWECAECYRGDFEPAERELPQEEA